MGYLLNKVLSKIDTTVPILQFIKATSALKTLHNNGIKIKLDEKDISGAGGIVSLLLEKRPGISLEPNSPYSVMELSKRLQLLGSENSLYELKEQGLSEVDINRDYFITDLWSRPLHDSFHQIWIEKSTHGQMNKYLELNKRFFTFAGSVSSKDQKNIIINILFQVMKIYDPSLAIHSETVAKYAVAIAREEGLSEEEIEEIRIAAILHDFGKLGYPKALWDKPVLNSEDRDQTRVHPKLSVAVLQQIKWISPTILDIIYYHHCYKGYPEGINPYKASKGALILAVADSFDAATSSRKYNKKVLTAEEALTDLKDKKYPVMIPITSGEHKKFRLDQVGVDQHFVGVLKTVLEKHPEMKPIGAQVQGKKDQA
jgi:HD-GYP domain-containing protein (c-di-GMP phosphodiesterase class II)